MKKTLTRIRVRYVETDQMGVAHHASYFAWMEAARTELLREGGMSYRELEEKGIFLPVREAFCRYRKSLHYDDVAAIETELLELRGASIKIGYRIFLEKEGEESGEGCTRDQSARGHAVRDLIAEGYTLHPFTDENGSVVRAPQFFLNLFG